MKETPDKIYRTTLYLDNDKGETKWKGQPVAGAENVEYTRTDAFIEKAEKFLEDNLIEEDCKFGWSEWTEVRTGYNTIDSFIRAFRNYMKGE